MMNWLRRVLTQNVGLKLLALALAFTIWSAVGGDIATEILIAVPVEFRNVPSGVHYDANPSRVEIRVRGPRWMVRRTSATDFSVPIDLSNMTQPGERIIVLKPQNVEAPNSVEIMDVTPPELKLSVTPPGGA
jgi:YbbR-like protein